MKTVSPPIRAKMEQRYGSEPILILEVEWVEGSPILYSDQKIDGASYPYPTLLSLGTFDTTMRLEGTSDTLQIRAEIDDTEGHIKEVIEDHDVHKRPAKIYLTYPGVNLEDKLLLTTGEVVTPFEWSEKSRSLQITILTKLTDKQIGFSMEEGDFANIPEEALGKAWPLVFGQVCHVPTVQVRAPRQGKLVHGTGIHDFTLDPRICQARKLTCLAKKTDSLKDCLTDAKNKTERSSCYISAKESAIGKQDANLQKLMKGEKVDAASDVGQECLTRRRSEICRLKQTIADQKLYESETLDIEGGVNFPQGEHVTLSIDGATFKGTFSGNTYTVLYRKHPAYDAYQHEDCKLIANRSPSTYSISVADAVLEVAGIYGTYYRFIEESKYSDIECEDTSEEASADTGGPSEAWHTYGLMTDESFFWMPAGTEVFMESEAEILHIASLNDGEVDSVAAYKAYADGRSLLTLVPPEFYTVYKTDYGDYTVTEIGMSKRMSLHNEWYSDELFVSFTSDVGPNMVDIMTWLIEKYTSLSIDTTSFESVRDRVEKYPCNFFMLDRPDVTELMYDLAYQSRCALFIRDNVVYLIYLPIEPVAAKSLTSSDVLAGSFKETMTPTGDIYTTNMIRWRKAGARVNQLWDIDFKLILKYNTEKFETSIHDWYYFTYNIYDLVLKSATFWLIRKANSWREIEFEVPMKHVDLDVGDAIDFYLPEFIDSTVKCVITTAQLNPKKNTILLKCWTPIRTGETETYYWAWPSQKAVSSQWPLHGDLNATLGFPDMSAPTGHLLDGGYSIQASTVVTNGDTHPSDLDDNSPTVSCEVSDDLDIEELPWSERGNVSSSQASQIEDEQPPEKYKEDKCGYPSNGRCGYLVKINYFTCTDSWGDERGALEGFGWTLCYTFGAPTAAKTFWRDKQAGAVDYDTHPWCAQEQRILKGDIHRDITEGRKVTEVLHFVCEDLWCPEPGNLAPCGVAEPFQHQGQFGESVLTDCWHLAYSGGNNSVENSKSEECTAWGEWDGNAPNSESCGLHGLLLVCGNPVDSPAKRDVITQEHLLGCPYSGYSAGLDEILDGT